MEAASPAPGNKLTQLLSAIREVLFYFGVMVVWLVAFYVILTIPFRLNSLLQLRSIPVTHAEVTGIEPSTQPIPWDFPELRLQIHNLNTAADTHRPEFYHVGQQVPIKLLRESAYIALPEENWILHRLIWSTVLGVPMLILFDQFLVWIKRKKHRLARGSCVKYFRIYLGVLCALAIFHGVIESIRLLVQPN